MIGLLLLASCGQGGQSDDTQSPAGTSVTQPAGTQPPTTPTTSTETPSNVSLPMHAPDTRTGIEDVDAIIATMTSGKSGPLVERVKYEMNSCGPERPAPACPAGKDVGTLVETASVRECAQYYLRKDQVPEFVAERVVPGNPYAIFRDTSGLRQLIFDRGTDGGVVSRITLTDDGQIVEMAVSCTSGKEHEPRRLDMLNDANLISGYAPDRFILMPPK